MKILLTTLLLPLLSTPLFAGSALEQLKSLLPQEVEPVRISATQEKEWTVMVYMNGKSNIEPFALIDMNRFETIGSGEKVNIVVELGRSKGLDNDTDADGNWSGVRRYLVKKDSDPDHINSQLLAEIGNPDMGNWKEASNFLQWAKNAYPAKKYMFIIWDHGWGWIDPKKDSAKNNIRSISHDFESGNYISTLDLGKIFKTAGKVDVYVSMACFMQMAEVAYEIKDGADVIVGSEEVIQLPSLNFEDFFNTLNTKPTMTAEQAGTVMVTTFHEMYSRPEFVQMLNETKYGTQLSAIRPKYLPEFAQKLKNWYLLAQKPENAEALSKAKMEVLRFEVGELDTDPDKLISFYGDLYNFVELTGKYAPNTSAEMKNAGKELNSFIENVLTIKNVWVGQDRTGKSYVNTHGISINIPGQKGNLIEYYPTYGNLQFNKASDWSDFMTYLEGIK